MKSLPYFSKFITTGFLDIVVKQTNIYSFQTKIHRYKPCRKNVFNWNEHQNRDMYYNYHLINRTGA